MGGDMNHTFVIKKAGEKFSLNPDLILAVCQIESGGDTYAVRYEAHWKYLLNPAYWAKVVNTSTATETVLQSCSWGLMQVMGTVAREHGFSGDFPELCSPVVGLEYGCRKLTSCLKRYPLLPEALASYNAGNPKRQAGIIYAGKVLAAMDKIAKEGKEKA